MRFILESHPQISCVDEYRGYMLLQHKDLLDKELSDSQTRYVGFKLPRITEQLLNPILTDIDIDLNAENNFTHVPIIFMVRSVFDVVSSMKTLIDQNNYWIKTWPEKWLKFWLEKNPSLEHEYGNELDIWKASSHKDVVSGAIMWKIKTLSLQKYKKMNLNVLPISYEHLVTNKVSTISQVLNFLELPWDDSVLSHEKSHHVEVDEQGIGIGNNDSTKPIFSQSVNKFSQTLTQSEILEIEKIVPNHEQLLLELINTENTK